MKHISFIRVSLLAMLLILVLCAGAFAAESGSVFSFAAETLSSEGIPLTARITGISNDAVTAVVPQTGPVTYKDKNNMEVTAYVPVVKIAKEAFYGKTNLQSVTFSAEVDVDFTGMFSGCTSLQSVDLSPFTLERIPTKMFYNCSALRTVTISPTYTVIGEKAFYGNRSLQAFSIPTAVTLIEDSAFFNCETAQITFAENNSLEEIRYDAFNNCAAMESVTLTGSLTKVGDRAFANCASLTELLFPGTVTVYGNGVINGCTGLKTLRIGGTGCPILNNYQWFQINNISGMVNSLETIIIGSGVTEIGKNMFYNEVASGRKQFQALTAVELPNTLTTIGENAFRAITTLTDIEFPSGLTYIGVSAFDGCENLKPVFPSDNRIETIERSAFDHCMAMESVTLNSTLRTLGNRAFAYCTSLTDLDIPPEVENYNTHMIRGCTALKTLTFGGSAVPVLNNYEWFLINCDYGSEDQLETITIRDGVTEIGKNMFNNDILSGRKMFRKLNTVVLPKTLITIGENAFKGITTLTNIELPESLTHIGICAFNECSAIKPVFPVDNKLETIEHDAFSKCTSMEQITLTSALTTLGDRAFAYCTSLSELVLPASVETYGYELIRGCTGLTYLEFGGEACPELNNYEIFAIRGTSNILETIVVRDGITTIGKDVFSNVSYRNEKQYPSLTTVVLPETVVSIGSNAFRELSALTQINIPSKVTLIKDHTFDGLTALENIDLPAAVETIENSAFLNCPNLKIAFAPDNHITSIAFDAFRNCAALEEVSLTGHLKNIDTDAFIGCISLTDVYYKGSRYRVSGITIADGNDRLKDAVWHYPELQTLDLPAETVVIEECAFESTTAQRVIIPEGITTIEDRAFANNPQLEEVIFTDDAAIISISANAFDGCTRILIIGPAGGAAQAFAENNNIEFIEAE